MPKKINLKKTVKAEFFTLDSALHKKRKNHGVKVGNTWLLLQPIGVYNEFEYNQAVQAVRDALTQLEVLQEKWREETRLTREKSKLDKAVKDGKPAKLVESTSAQRRRAVHGSHRRSRVGVAEPQAKQKS